MPATRFESDIRKLHLSRQFLIVMVLLFVALMIWTFVTIGSSQNKTSISTELINLSKPLNPSIDRTVFEKLEQKRFFTDQEIRNFTIYRLLLNPEGNDQVVVPIDTVIQTTTAPRPSPTSSASASPSPTPTASPTPSAAPTPSPGTSLQDSEGI